MSAVLMLVLVGVFSCAYVWMLTRDRVKAYFLQFIWCSCWTIWSSVWERDVVGTAINGLLAIFWYWWWRKWKPPRKRKPILRAVSERVQQLIDKMALGSKVVPKGAI